MNGIEVTQLDVNNATVRVEERYKSIFGENFSTDQLEEQELLNILRSQIINQKIIESVAFDNNLDISLDDVKRAIIREETFLDENGKFDQSIFEAAIRGAGMIPDEYLQFVLTSISADNLINTISQSNFVLNNDLIDFTAFAEATKDIKFIKSDRAPLGRTVTTEEVGNVAAFLCSNLASGITGEICYVDGGFNTAALSVNE